MRADLVWYIQVVMEENRDIEGRVELYRELRNAAAAGVNFMNPLHEMSYLKGIEAVDRCMERVRERLYGEAEPLGETVEVKPEKAV